MVRILSFRRLNRSSSQKKGLLTNRGGAKVAALLKKHKIERRADLIITVQIEKCSPLFALRVAKKQPYLSDRRVIGQFTVGTASNQLHATIGKPQSKHQPSPSLDEGVFAIQRNEKLPGILHSPLEQVPL